MHFGMMVYKTLLLNLVISFRVILALLFLFVFLLLFDHVRVSIEGLLVVLVDEFTRVSFFSTIVRYLISRDTFTTFFEITTFYSVTPLSFIFLPLQLPNASQIFILTS